MNVGTGYNTSFHFVSVNTSQIRGSYLLIELKKHRLGGLTRSHPQNKKKTSIVISMDGVRVVDNLSRVGLD